MLADFNPRTRVGCDKRCVLAAAKRSNFNPRTRVGCDFLWRVVFRQHNISIHAPAWGATTISVRTATTLLLFQSTHPRGVRRVDIQQLAQVLRFQSTHPRGVRHHDLSDSVVLLDISIHAPAWGATGVSGATAPGERFQSTHPRGVRQAGEKAKIEAKAFQSTHPRGVRQQKKACIMP